MEHRTVRELIPSVTALARALNLTPNAIYRWIDVNRIPGKHLIRVANFYDVELRDLLPLTGSEKSHKVYLKLKPRFTLRVLLDVYEGKKTLDEAVEELDQSLISLKLILVNWGDELPELYRVMEALDKKELSLDQACLLLKVKKYTIHGLRRKFGYAPGHPASTRRQTRVIRSQAELAALRCISGKMTAKEAANAHGVSERTLYRAVESMYPPKLQSLVCWPKEFREALAEDLSKKEHNLVQKWREFVLEHRLLVDSVKYIEAPASWKGQPLKRLLVGILLGETTLKEVAEATERDAASLSRLFTSDLAPLEITYSKLMGLPMTHQIVVAQILMATMQRKRRW